MKLRLAFFILSLSCCLSHNLFSQKKTDINNYYKLINKAELEICNGNIQEAFKSYRESFNHIEAPFTHDLYNAFICSNLLKKTVYDYYRQIRERGVSKTFFSEIKHLNPHLIDSLENIKTINVTFDRRYRDSIYTMAKRDQMFRISPEQDIFYEDTIKKINIENGDALLDIIKRRGFPSESLVGNDSNNITTPLFEVLIFHHARGSKFQKINFSSIIANAIKQGKLDNRIGTELMDYSDGTDRFGTNAAGVCYYYWEADYNKDSLSRAMLKADHPWYMGEIESSALIRYNRERPAYYLDNVDDYRKKIVFQMNNSIFDFGLYGYKFTGGLADKEQYDYLMKNLVEISK